MNGENKYGGHDVQADWQRIRGGLSNNLVNANMGDTLKYRQAVLNELGEIRKRCVARAYQCFEFAHERKYLDTFPLVDVLRVIKMVDRHELLDALRLKTPKGFADHLINSYKFENE